MADDGAGKPDEAMPPATSEEGAKGAGAAAEEDPPEAAEEKGEIRIEPEDIAALTKAVAHLRERPGLVLTPELSFFKELLMSWGAPDPVTRLESRSAAEAEAKAAAEKAAAEKAAAEPPKPAAPTTFELEDSDEELVGTVIEMELPPGLLEDELKEEPADPSKAGEKEEEDLERLTKDPGPYPALPPKGSQEPSDARKKVLAKVKQQANQALETGNIQQAMERYTNSIKNGGVSALMLATRAGLLLQLRRPCAAIRDCCAALQLNPDCGKAYHVRGAAHRKLGHWKKAHRDLGQGQKLDFSDDYAKMQQFVAKKVGISPDLRSGRAQDEGARKAVELLFKEKKKPTADLRSGQAVRIGGLVKAQHLNGKRGIVRRYNEDDPDRWEVELRMERGRLETKSIRYENIMVVRASEAANWQLEEMKFQEEQKKREKEDRIWQAEESKRKRLLGQQRGFGHISGFPEMDTSERLEAEMSALPLDLKAIGLLRRISASEALEVLNHVGLRGVANVSAFVKMKVRQKLGEPDSDEEKAS